MEDGAGHGQTWGDWDATRSYFWEGEHSLRHSTKRQDSPLLFPALLVTEFSLGEDFGWDQGMWEPRVRYLGFYSALETSSQVASHSRIAYMNKDDGCSWLRVGAIRQSLYPWKSHGFLSILLLTQWRFKLSCRYSHSDFQALWALKGMCQSLFLFAVGALSPSLIVISVFSWPLIYIKVSGTWTSAFHRAHSKWIYWDCSWIAHKHISFILAQLSMPCLHPQSNFQVF